MPPLVTCALREVLHTIDTKKGVPVQVALYRAATTSSLPQGELLEC